MFKVGLFSPFAYGKEFLGVAGVPFWSYHTILAHCGTGDSNST